MTPGRTSLQRPPKITVSTETSTKSKAGCARPCVFISYSQQVAGERVLAERIQKDLASRGVEAFRDESSIDPGTEWGQEIQRRLEDWATHVLVIVSPTSMKSKWVQHELEAIHARYQNGTLTVLWLHPNRDTGLPEEHWLRQVQRVRVRGRDPAYVTEREWCGAIASALLPEVEDSGRASQLH